MDVKIRVMQGDITKVSVDVIVNAANRSLMGGGGVDGAIHRAGGPQILQECKEIVARQGECATGQAVVTVGGNLPATYVLHTVGPVWNGGHQNERALLADCYKNSLKKARELHCRSIAFPCISTGIYHFPKLEAASIAVAAVRQFASENSMPEEIIFVCFDDENYLAIKTSLEKNSI